MNEAELNNESEPVSSSSAMNGIQSEYAASKEPWFTGPRVFPCQQLRLTTASHSGGGSGGG